MAVNNPKQEYLSQSNKWTMIDDCLNGQDRIKSASTRYLPLPNGVESANDSSYKKYLNIAMFYNIIAQTKNVLLGLSFKKNPIVDLPKPLEYMKDESSSTGESLSQFSKSCMSEAISFGRCGILIDYPMTNEQVTVKNKERDNIRATMQLYGALSIINWHCKTINAKSVLHVVVLKECVEKENDSDEFLFEDKDQYRVLCIEDGIYVQKIYDESGKLEYIYTPKDANGNYLTYIPFVFIGSETNSPNVDESPLYDLATMNIKHYQFYADNCIKMHFQSLPTLVMENLSDETIERFESDGGIKLGATRGLMLGEAETAKYLEISESSALSGEIEKLESKMIALGARLVRDSIKAETATTTIIKSNTENSTLAHTANNVSRGIKTALQYAYQFEDKNPQYDDIKFSINTDFVDDVIDPSVLAQLVSSMMAGVASKRTIIEYLKRVEFISEDISVDDYMSMLENEADVI